MRAKKITDLSLISPVNVAKDDLFLLVDVSDKTFSPSGTNKCLPAFSLPTNNFHFLLVPELDIVSPNSQPLYSFYPPSAFYLKNLLITLGTPAVDQDVTIKIQHSPASSVSVTVPSGSDSIKEYLDLSLDPNFKLKFFVETTDVGSSPTPAKGLKLDLLAY